MTINLRHYLLDATSPDFRRTVDAIRPRNATVWPRNTLGVRFNNQTVATAPTQAIVKAGAQDQPFRDANNLKAGQGAVVRVFDDRTLPALVTLVNRDRAWQEPEIL